MKIMLFQIILFLIFSSGAQAQERKSDFICEPLKSEEAYKKGKNSYKYLLEGKDGYVFPSKRDFKKNFQLKEKTIENFSALNNALKNKGIDLVITMPPTRGLAHFDKAPLDDEYFLTSPFIYEQARKNYEASINQLKDAGIMIADFSDLTYPAEGFFNRRDHHWTPHGSKVSADKTAKIIKTLDNYQALPKTPFKTVEDGVKKVPGSYGKFIEKICGFKVEDEKVPNVQTSKVDDSQDDLFGSIQQSSAVLVGTSNCVETVYSYANFAGWLREMLSTDIHNVSIAGAGIEAPMLTFLSSEDFIEDKAKIIIWELASHYNFNSKFRNIFAEGIPAAHGKCENPILKRDINLSQKENMINDLTSYNESRGDQNYIRIEFSKPVESDIKLVFKSMGGSTKEHIFKYWNRAHEARKVFYLSIPNVLLKSILLKIEKDQKELDNANVEICAY